VWILSKFIIALLHRVAGPLHRRHGHRGGRRHRRPIPTVLKRPTSPSPNRTGYRSMEPSDHVTSPRGRWGHLCAVHGWGPCPNRVAPAVESSSRGQEGEAEGGEEEEPWQISIVAGLVQGSLTRQTARITAGPRGQPKDHLRQGPPPRLPCRHPPSLRHHHRCHHQSKPTR
jgi:hypothetical protein